MEPKFKIGRTVITRAALDALDAEDTFLAVTRHACGDWGEVCDEDRLANEQSLKDGSRLLSIYTDRNGVRFWVITEADRSLTTILLPDDY